MSGAAPTPPSSHAGERPSQRGAIATGAADAAGRRCAPGWALLAAAAATAAFYLPFLGKGFVSEDFLLIRLHRESPPWADLAATLTGPWLGMRIFQFYRPVAALLFGAEANLFGAWSTGYNAVHLIAHLLSTAIVTALAWRLLSGCSPPAGGAAPSRASAAAAAGVAGLFFGLYPLSPNAVLFAASFATLFGAVGTLGAAVLYVEARQRAECEPARPGARRLLAGSLALHAVALGCYESAAALPLWLALYELPRLASAGRRRSAVVTLLPFAVLTAAYFALRGAIFDQVLGGYPNVAEQLRNADFTIGAAALRSLARLPSPWFGGSGAASWEIVGLLAGGLALALWLATAPERARGRPLLGLFGLALGWALAFQAPFSFQLVDPSAGRFWYLAAAGPAIALGALIARARLSRRARGLQIGLVALATILLLARNSALLRDHLGWMDQAADTAAAVAEQIASVAREAGESPLFVAEYPLFIESASGVYLAQVYHYGLRSALGPPFRSESIDVYPLPAARRADVRRLATDHAVFRWLDGERLMRLRPDPAGLPRLLEVRGPAPGSAVLPEDAATIAVTVAAPAGARARVVVVATGNASAERVRLDESRGVQLPAEFLRFWERLAPGPQYWWVETLAGDGTVTAQSAPRSIHVLPPR